MTLVVIGAASLAASCSDQRQYSRNVYRSRADCLRDYADRYCEPGPRGGYYGAYFWAGGGRGAPANDPGPGATATDGKSAAAATTTAPTRGGIGGTGRGRSGGG